MDRPTVLMFLENQYLAVLSDLNVPEGTLVLYNGALDMAFRALGTSESSLRVASVDDNKTIDLLALSDYYTLEALLRHVPTFADVQAYTPAIAKKRSQVFQQLRLLRDDAATKVSALGYAAVSSDGIDSWQMARITLDYLEPDTEGF